jgi:hypothetical protein
MRDLAVRWAYLLALLAVFGFIGFFVVREFNSNASEPCFEMVENTHGYEELVEVECPDFY